MLCMFACACHGSILLGQGFSDTIYEDGVEVIYVQPHVQPIFIPDDEDDDDAPWKNMSSLDFGIPT